MVKNLHCPEAVKTLLTTRSNRLPHVLEIFALFMALGILTTLCIPETARKTLEELAGEDTGSHDDEVPAVKETAKDPQAEEKSV
jgi:PHS family inorganic phosphate transporter-like MFS transporter